MATWGVANLGWMYYENWLHVQPPPLSIVRMLFDSQGVFFAIALFLDKEKDSPRFDAETLFDSLQIAIVFFSGFFGLYYVQVLSGVSGPGSELLMTGNYLAINVALTVAAAIAALRARTKRSRFAVRRTDGFPADQRDFVGDCGLHAEHPQRADGNMVRPRMVPAISGVCDLGVALGRVH